MTAGPVCLVTGANGLIGNAVLSRWRAEGRAGQGVARGVPGSSGCISGPDLTEPGANWRPHLRGCDVLVHAAARVHVMAEAAPDPLAAFRAANVAGTLNLARQAVETGVRRFVFLSSIKVLGESTAPHRPFTAEDAPAPQGPYAYSKAEAEAGLRELAKQTGLEVVIIRPPLVYGPGVKGNFLTMMHWLRRGVPLPFGSVSQNRRTLVALDNLVDLIVTCMIHPAAANETFLAGDGEDLSTAELIRRLAAAMGVPARLVPIPRWAIEGSAALLGRRNVVQRLCGNLQVDIADVRARLGWSPVISVNEGLRLTVTGFQ